MKSAKPGIGWEDRMNSRLPDESGSSGRESAPSEIREGASRLTSAATVQADHSGNGVKAAVCLVTFLLCSATLAHAQYSLKSSSFAAVGVESSGGSYSVRSTIGTTGGGATTSGGNYSITSSPWMLAVVQTPDAPRLSIATASGAVQVSWPSPSTGWVLQQNTNNVGSVNWSNVTATIQDDGTNRTFTVSSPTGNRFYRLFKP